MSVRQATRQDIESPYAWMRLAASLLLMTIGGSGMYSVTVVLPRIQEEFGVAIPPSAFRDDIVTVGKTCEVLGDFVAERLGAGSEKA